MIYNYRDFEGVYKELMDTISGNIRTKLNYKVSQNPRLLLDYLKEVKTINLKELTQQFIYPFAKLSVDGHMPLIEDECKWRNTFKSDKPKFVIPKEYLDDFHKGCYETNPFAYRSDMGMTDYAFEIYVQYEHDIQFKEYKNQINITIIVDHDYEGHKLYKDNPLYHNEGKAYFVFRVDIDNTEDVNLVLGYLKNFIINAKIKNLISKHCEKVVEEIGKNISEEILKNYGK